MKTILFYFLLVTGTFSVTKGEDTILPQISESNRDSLVVSSIQNINWGKGFFIETQLLQAQQAEIGLGFRFDVGDLTFLRRSYAGNARGNRLGLGIGLKYITDEIINDPDTSLYYYSNAIGPYFRLTYDSPILRDIVSVSSHLKVMYLKRLSDADDRLAEEDWGFGIGGNISFWLYRNMSIDFGMTVEGTGSKPLSETLPLHDRPLLQRKFRTQFGITVFFK